MITRLIGDVLAIAGGGLMGASEVTWPQHKGWMAGGLLMAAFGVLVNLTRLLDNLGGYCIF